MILKKNRPQINISIPTKITVKKAFTLLFIFFVINSTTNCQDDYFLYWDFNDEKRVPNFNVDSPQEGEEISLVTTKERVTKTNFEIHGLAKYVKGVKGSAMKFDGFSSYIKGWPKLPKVFDEEGYETDPMPEAISIEAWIAIGAYPWNWAPILTLGKYKTTGFYFGIDSRGRVGFHMSDATSVWHECNSELNPKTKLGLDIQKWHHVVGTYNPKSGLAVYIDGELANTYNDFTFDYGIVYSNLEEGFSIGKNSVDLAPTDPIRDWATYPSSYTFDGIMDELKVHKKALSKDEVVKIYKSVQPEKSPSFDSRRFPTIKPSGRFGANYTRLEFYPEWDAIWPVGDYMDVVVQFDELPTKVMFWRGTRYSACQVSENGKWMADQSRETGSNWFLGDDSRENIPTGCVEHMSDVQCRSSRVAIIENNDARILVNWRYLQMDVKFRQIDLPNETGFGEWGNEYYYIYPDGVTVRKVLPGMGGWQETIFLNEPGTRPEDNVELEACTLMNLKGESKSYSWEDGYPIFDLEEAVIQLTHFKAEYKPFMIFREGGSFAVFDLEVRPEYSHFPWWNHWPVAQTISDGRSANAPDRVAHSSLSWGDPGGEAALYGMTNQEPTSLVDLAKSWNKPPKMNLKGDDHKNRGYDYTQRAYIIDTKKQGVNIELEFDVNIENPLFNLALVVNNWGGEEVALSLNGKDIAKGKDFRTGTEYDAEGNLKLIVWIKHKAKSKTRVLLSSVE